MGKGKRVAFYLRVSTGGQTVENQRQELARQPSSADGRSPSCTAITASPVPKAAINRNLNCSLDRLLREFTNFYLFELNEIFNFVGRMHLQDDVVSHMTHMSIISDVDDIASLDSQRLVPPVSHYSVFDTKTQLRAFARVFFDTLSDSIKILRGREVVKLIIVDLDDTLWRGVAAEEVTADFVWSEPWTEGWPLAFVEALLYFKKRGGLLAICSKNDYEPSVARFEKIWRTELTLSDFVSVKINWKSKSDNIAEILSEVNVLAENAIFVDDNPRELDEVKSRYPGMRCLGGNHKDWRRIILRSPETQVPFITTESQQRTDTVRAHIERESVARTMNRDDWLRSLNLQQKLLLLKDAESPLFGRAIELINKTNQFNTTGKRWSVSELEAFFENGGLCLLSSLRDKTMDNGVIGAALLMANEIVQVVLSCRVFGLGAEIEMGRMGTVIALASHDKAYAYATLVDTGRNRTCHGYFESLGFIRIGARYEASAACSSPAWIAVEADPAVALLANSERLVKSQDVPEYS
jgi:FkbH-like protein